MKTTINLSPELKQILDCYIESLEGQTITKAIERALSIAFPILFEFLPKEKESEKDCLLRYIACLKKLSEIHTGIAKDVIVSELSKMQLIAFSKRFVDRIERIETSKQTSNNI